MAEKTNGTFAVASDAAHLTELLQAHTVPPPELKHKGKRSDIHMIIYDSTSVVVTVSLYCILCITSIHYFTLEYRQYDN